MNELVVSRSELFALPEYSCSVPTLGAPPPLGPWFRRNVKFQQRDPAEWQVAVVTDVTDKVVSWNFLWAVDEGHEVHRGRR